MGDEKKNENSDAVTFWSLSLAAAAHVARVSSPSAQANDNGMALVGVWHQEMADAYSTSLKERGLIAETRPAD